MRLHRLLHDDPGGMVCRTMPVRSEQGKVMAMKPFAKVACSALIITVGLVTADVVHAKPAAVRTNTKPGPEISAVTFAGSNSSPTISVTGRHLGKLLTGFPNSVTDCGTYTNNGDDYGSQFNFSDTTHTWQAGAGVPPTGSCIGIIVESWKPHRVVFTFGSAYGSFDHWTADQGDRFSLTLNGAVFTGTVSYS